VAVLGGSRGGVSSKRLPADFVGVLEKAPPAPLAPVRSGKVCDGLTGAGLFDILPAVGPDGEKVRLPTGTRQIGGDEVVPGIVELCDGLTVSRLVVGDNAVPVLEVKEGGFRGIGGAFLFWSFEVVDCIELIEILRAGLLGTLPLDTFLIAILAASIEGGTL